MSQLIVLGGVLAAILAGLGITYFAGRRAGIDSVKGDTYQEAAFTLRREQEAAASAPSSKDAIVERLRKGGGL